MTNNANTKNRYVRRKKCLQKLALWTLWRLENKARSYGLRLRQQRNRPITLHYITLSVWPMERRTSHPAQRNGTFRSRTLSMFTIITMVIREGHSRRGQCVVSSNESLLRNRALQVLYRSCKELQGGFDSVKRAFPSGQSFVQMCRYRVSLF